MKKMLGVLLVSLSLTAYAATAFLKGERVDGMYKICFYDHLGDTVAITVKAHQLCPLTIKM